MYPLLLITFVMLNVIIGYIICMYQSVITRGDMYLRREVDRREQGSNVLNVPVSDYLLVIAQGSLCSAHNTSEGGVTDLAPGEAVKVLLVKFRHRDDEIPPQ